MTVFITGGAGFIGSHLSQRLLEIGKKVTVLDNLSTGRLTNIQHLLDNPNFNFIEGDICDKPLVKKLLRDSGQVYHLAAAVGVQLIVDRPVHTIETNIGGTEIVLNAANEYKKRILIASTSEVYGKSEKVPFCEDDDLVLGSTSLSRWSYACSKAIDEFLGFAFWQQFGLEVIIGRFFNTIGPRQTGQYGMVVPRFVQAALAGEDLCVYGNGNQSRCFCYVEDVVDALVRLMDCKKAAGRVYNIGNNQEITMSQLADKIISVTASKSGKRFVSYEEAYGRPIDDMMRRVPSLSRIKEIIGWEPRTGLDESLRRIIEYFNTEGKA
jgi:UDP-glucose 4-epimerase